MNGNAMLLVSERVKGVERSQPKKERKDKKAQEVTTGPEGFEPSPPTCTMSSVCTLVVLGGLQTFSCRDYEPSTDYRWGTERMGGLGGQDGRAVGGGGGAEWACA
jgi:hypothetical protein